jgi:hypothetical protein
VKGQSLRWLAEVVAAGMGESPKPVRCLSLAKGVNLRLRRTSVAPEGVL